MPNLDTNKLTPIMDIDTMVMLTLTFNDRSQYGHLTIPHRLNKFREHYTSHIKPQLIKCFNQFDMSMEISEVLASEGKKYPRLHYHILGTIKDPIVYHMTMGLFFNKYDIGYHNTLVDTPEKMAYYDMYILKQRAQWARCPYVIKHKDQYP